MTDAIQTREITLVREYPISKERMFALWTEPDHIAHWWGPDGFTAPHVVSDPRPGGELTITMEGPDGVSQVMQAHYLAVMPPDHIAVAAVVVGTEGERLLESSHEVTFVSKGALTEVTVHAQASIFASQMLPALHGMHAGWNQSLQCLDDVVNGATDRMLVLCRMYDTPTRVVFPLWTDAEHLEQWWGPHGFSLTTTSIDARTGGTWDFSMHAPNGKDFLNHMEYEEVSPPERIVLTHTSPGTDDPPFTMIVTFDEMDGKTVLSLRHIYPTAEAKQFFATSYGALDGATQTLTRLGDHLAALTTSSVH